MFFLIDWLSFVEGGLFEIGRPRSRGLKNFGRRWTNGVDVLKIGRFSWMSCVYHPLGS